MYMFPTCVASVIHYAITATTSIEIFRTEFGSPNERPGSGLTLVAQNVGPKTVLTSSPDNGLVGEFEIHVLENPIFLSEGIFGRKNGQKAVRFIPKTVRFKAKTVRRTAITVRIKGELVHQKQHKANAFYHFSNLE